MDSKTISAGMMRRRHKRTMDAANQPRDVVADTLTGALSGAANGVNSGVGNTLNGVVDVVNGVAHLAGDTIEKTTPTVKQLGLKRDVSKAAEDLINLPPAIVYDVAHVAGDAVGILASGTASLGLRRDVAASVGDIINLPPAVVNDVAHVAGDVVVIGASGTAGLGLRGEMDETDLAARGLISGVLNGVGGLVGGLLGGHQQQTPQPQPQPQPSPQPAPQPSPKPSPPQNNGSNSGGGGGNGGGSSGNGGGNGGGSSGSSGGGSASNNNNNNNNSDDKSQSNNDHSANDDQNHSSGQSGGSDRAGGTGNVNTSTNGANGSNSQGQSNASVAPNGADAGSDDTKASNETTQGVLAAQNDNSSSVSTSTVNDANSASQTVSFTDASGNVQTSVVAAPSSTDSLTSGNGGHITPSVVDANSPDPGKSDGSKIGVPIGIVAALIAGALIVFFVMRKRRNIAKERRASHYPGYTIAGRRQAKGASGESWLQRPPTNYYGSVDGTYRDAVQDPFHDDAQEPEMRERDEARLSMGPDYSEQARSISPPAMAAGISNNAAGQFYNLPSAQAGTRMSSVDQYLTASESRESHRSLSSEAETSHAHSVGLDHYMEEMEQNLAGHGSGRAAASTFGSKSSATSHSNYHADRSSQTSSSQQHASLTSSSGGVARYISRDEFKARHRKQASSTNNSTQMYYDGSVTKSNGYQSRQPGMDAAGAAVSASKAYSPYEELQRGTRVARYSTGSDPFHDATDSSFDHGPFRDSIASDSQPASNQDVDNAPRRNTKVKFQRDSKIERSAPPSVVIVDHDAESIVDHAEHGENLVSGRADPFGNDNRRSQHARSGHVRDSQASSNHSG